MFQLDKNNKNTIKAATKRGFEQSEKAPLGSIAKSTSPCPSVDTVISAIRTARSKRFELLSSVRSIYLAEGTRQGLELPTKYHRTTLCKHAVTGSEVLLMKGKNPETNKPRGYFTGLQTCGSVWTCPICANRIQETRRQEIALAMKFLCAEAQGKQAVMVTFTFPHTVADKLKDLLEKFSKSLMSFKSGKAFVGFKNRYGFEGLIRSLEITRGPNGWHPHTHELFFVDKELEQAEFKEWLQNRWLNVCSKSGLVDINDDDKVDAFIKHSLDVKFNCSTSDYLAKFDDKANWGVDREIAKASSKNSKKNGMHPFELAHKGYSQLFIEYTEAIKGKAQLFWSRDLKKKVGIVDITDEEISEEDKKEEDTVIGFLRKIEDWKTVTAYELRSKILDMVEDGFDIVAIRRYIAEYEQNLFFK
jgi:plasmid rolling circle replication initiator protein Rep